MRPSPRKSAHRANLFDSPRECGLPSDTHMRQRSHLPGSTPSLSSGSIPASIRRVVVCVFLLAAIGCFASEPAWAFARNENHAIQKEIETLETQWRQAVISNDVNQMDHLL